MAATLGVALGARMRLRRFRDATLHGAMAQIRGALGDEALILQTRRVAGGVEITAALDQPEAALPSVASDGGPPRRDQARPAPRGHSVARAERPAGPPEDGEQVRLTQLDWHGVPVGLARRLRAGPLAFALSLALRFAKLDLEGGAPVLFAGPPGAGKTLTVARLATRLVLAGAHPVVVCADGGRAGAAEQLAAFTRLLGIQLIELSSPAEARSVLKGLGGRRQPVLIDAQGCDPWQSEGVDLLQGLLGATRAVLATVLPAGLDPAEAADLAQGFAELGASALVATRLDGARRLGGVLSAAAAGLPLVELGVGAGAADGLVPASPDLLARRLLAPPPGERKERT